MHSARFMKDDSKFVLSDFLVLMSSVTLLWVCFTANLVVQFD